MEKNDSFQPVGKRLDNLNKKLKTDHPEDIWVMKDILNAFLSIIDSSSSLEQQRIVSKELNRLFDAYEFRYNTILETIIMTKETLRMQMLSGVITESEYKAKLEELNSTEEKDSLNEGMIGGIVGIGAINQIPPRAKTDYETAFEHFLGARYELNEEMESGEFDSYLTGLFDWIDLGDEYEEGNQSYTFEKMEWADEDALGGEEAEMFEPAHEYIKAKGEIKLTDPVSGIPLTFRTEGEDIVVNFNTEDF